MKSIMIWACVLVFGEEIDIPIPAWFWYAALAVCVALLVIVGVVLWVLLRKPPHP